MLGEFSALCMPAHDQFQPAPSMSCWGNSPIGTGPATTEVSTRPQHVMLGELFGSGTMTRTGGSFNPPPACHAGEICGAHAAGGNSPRFNPPPACHAGGMHWRWGRCGRLVVSTRPQHVMLGEFPPIALGARLASFNPPPACHAGGMVIRATHAGEENVSTRPQHVMLGNSLRYRTHAVLLFQPAPSMSCWGNHNWLHIRFPAVVSTRPQHVMLGEW